MDDWVMWSKFLPRLIYPSSLVLYLLFLTLLLLVFRRRLGSVISLLIALGVIVLTSSPLISNMYLRHERQFLPTPVNQSPTADAIVLLGGDISIPIPPRVDSEIRGNRALHAMRLYRAGKAPLIIVSGGNVFPQKGYRPEAEYTAELLQEWGIQANAIVFEGTSRNTRENALETQKLLNTRGLNRILLVTSAFHMPRAIGVFQRLGIDVIPSPSSISAQMVGPRLLNWYPTVDGLGVARSVMPETLGIFIYRFFGWID